MREPAPAGRIPGHEVITVAEAELANNPRYRVLARASECFDVFVTIDRGFASQHNLENLSLGIVLIRVRRYRMERGRRHERRFATSSPPARASPLMPDAPGLPERQSVEDAGQRGESGEAPVGKRPKPEWAEPNKSDVTINPAHSFESHAGVHC